MRSAVKTYLTTLRRIPSHIVLAVASRDIEVNNPQKCVCGWAIREMLSAMNGAGAEEKLVGTGSERMEDSADQQSADLFGGSRREWCRIYVGVQGATPNNDNWRIDDNENDIAADVEEAFARRVAECVR